jgi:hypothetical protein
MVLSTSVSYEAMNGKTYSNLPACSWVPSFATDKVTSVAPRHRVLGALAHGVNCGAATVRPPRVEVAVIGSDGAVALPSSRSVRKSKGALKTPVTAVTARRREVKETMVE